MVMPFTGSYASRLRWTQSLRGASSETPTQEFPRVSIGRVVINRRSWVAPSRWCDWTDEYRSPSFSSLVASERARMELGIPRKVFVRPVEAPWHKPQYVDFDSPLLLRATRRRVRRAAQGLWIEEALPSVDDYDGQTPTGRVLTMLAFERSC